MNKEKHLSISVAMTSKTKYSKYTNPLDPSKPILSIPIAESKIQTNIKIVKKTTIKPQTTTLMKGIKLTKQTMITAAKATVFLEVLTRTFIKVR